MKPILFSEQMIKSIMSGEKTETRRVLKLPASWSTGPRGGFVFDPKYWGELTNPYGIEGDQLWVREKFCIECPYGPPEGCDNPDHTIYWANEEPIVRDSIIAKWKPSIFMPKYRSRITLNILSIRVERLQDITEEGAIAEGLSPGVHKLGKRVFSTTDEFISLWDSINYKRGYGWAKNPWVWVIKFEVE